MLELHFKLTKEDYLNFQLYAASRNPRIKKQRLRGRIFASLLFLIFGITTLVIDSFLKYIYFSATIFVFFLYPLYTKWFYKRHFRKYIEQTFDPDNDSITLLFSDSALEAKDKKATSSMKLQDLLSFTETSDYFYLQVSKAVYFILPKERVPAEEVRIYLQDRSKALNIPYKEELDWKWK